MLQLSKARGGEESAGHNEIVSPAEFYAAMREFVSRQYPTIILGMCLCVILGVLYIFTSPAKYTGRAVIVIDTHKTQTQAQTLDELPIDSTTVDTQIEILKSENIAASVINELHLTEDPEFVSPKVDLIHAIFNALLSLIPEPTASVEAPSVDDRRMRRVVQTFEDDLAVRRIGLTYAIEIEFRSLGPDRASQLANAVADAYIVDTLEAKYQTTRRAGAWLQERLKELRGQSSSAERSVNEFKAKNNIVDSGGRLLNEQQLAELNSALIQAKAQTTEAKARLDRVGEVLHADNSDSVTGAVGAVADSLHNDVITKLRQQYLEYAAKEADWSHRYGGDHLAAVNLRNQMHEISRNIFDELGRIAETYKSDYEIARAQEDSIQKSLSDIVTQSQTVNGAEVTLHDLDSTAQSYRALYDSFLQRYMESVQQQTFPISDARLITRATRPLSKSSPKTVLIFALAAIAGLTFGVGAGVLREISDRVFRTTAQVRDRLEVDCLAIVPFVREGNRGSLMAIRAAPAGVRIISREQDLFSLVIDSPFSRFTESIRALKVSIDLSQTAKTNKVIAVTSAQPNEGKSTIAATLAKLASHAGSRVLLIDGDLRNPSLSGKLARGATRGLLDLISGSSPLEDVVWTDGSTGLSFLPSATTSRLPNSSEILASDAMKTTIDRLREAYDYIIIDLSPLAPEIDVRAVAPLIDSFLFVVEWGRTKVDVAEQVLGSASGVFSNLLGVVINKADMGKLKRYQVSRTGYPYKRSLGRYG